MYLARGIEEEAVGRHHGLVRGLHPLQIVLHQLIVGEQLALALARWR